MKNVRFAAYALAFLSVTAAPVLAADMPVRMPVKAPAPAVFNWTGFYAGVNGGYAWADGRVRLSETFGPATARVGLDLDTWFVGIQGGYNYQLPNNYLLGIEADYQWARGRDSASIANFPTGGGPTVVTGRFNSFATLRGRLGYAQDRTLYYLTGGLAWPGARFTAFLPFDNDQYFVSGKPKVGWVVGAGVEWVLRDNWTAKVEYQYLDFGARTVTGNSGPNQNATVTSRFDLNAHTIRFGINRLFQTGG